MAHYKFDPAKLEKLNDPRRFETLIPEVMWEALGSPDPAVVIDIGAGTGLFAAKWTELAPTATVYAADMSEAAIEWMDRNRSQVADGRMVTVLSSERGVPLPDGIADIVTMVNLHHELADPDAIYGEAARLLRRAGRLLVVDWAPIETPKGPPLAVRITADAAVAFLARAGLVSVRSHAGLPHHWLVTAEKP